MASAAPRATKTVIATAISLKSTTVGFIGGPTLLVRNGKFPKMIYAEAAFVGSAVGTSGM